ncbi:hypothetical protein ACJX0J_015355, partial [Zea mays]
MLPIKNTARPHISFFIPLLFFFLDFLQHRCLLRKKTCHTYAISVKKISVAGDLTVIWVTKFTGSIS